MLSTSLLHPLKKKKKNKPKHLQRASALQIYANPSGWNRVHRRVISVPRMHCLRSHLENTQDTFFFFFFSFLPLANCRFPKRSADSFAPSLIKVAEEARYRQDEGARRTSEEGGREERARFGIAQAKHRYHFLLSPKALQLCRLQRDNQRSLLLHELHRCLNLECFKHRPPRQHPTLHALFYCYNQLHSHTLLLHIRLFIRSLCPQNQDDYVAI